MKPFYQHLTPHRESSIKTGFVIDNSIYNPNLLLPKTGMFIFWDFPCPSKTNSLRWVLNSSNLCCPIKSTLKLIAGRCNCD